MANIKRFSAIAPKVWELAADLEKSTGVAVEQIKFVKYSNKGAQILAYLDERGAPIEKVLRGVRELAEQLGSAVEATLPYRTDTQPSGRGVTVTVATLIEELPLVFKALLDADQYEHALTVRQLTGVAA